MKDAPYATETPYEAHQKTGHHMTRHSPNGLDIIEECSVCGMRWLHHPGNDWPITLWPPLKVTARTIGAHGRPWHAPE